MKTISNKTNLVIAAFFIVLSTIACIAPLNVLIRFVQDDAFYGFDFARHIYLGRGSTCDGINQANGYQPLKILILIPFGGIINYSRELGARFIFLYDVLLLGLSFIVLNIASKRIFEKNAEIVLFWALSALSLSGIYGLETALSCLMWSFVIIFSLRFEENKTFRDGLLLGIFSGLLMLSRTDSFVYVAICDIVWFYHIIRENNTPDRKTMLSAWIWGMFIQFCLVSAYLYFNYSHFGNIMPISAAIKTGRYSKINLGWTTSILAKIAIIGAIMAVPALYKIRKLSNLMSLKIILLGTLFYMGLMALKGNGESFNWYFAIPVINGGFALAYIVNIYQARFKYVYHMAITICALILLIFCLGKFKVYSFQSNLEKAIWISKNTPVNSVLADSDCGILGYFSERSCVNLDGLSNSYEFQKAIDNNKTAEWLKNSGFNLMVFPANQPEPVNGSFELPIRPNMHGITRTVIVKAEHIESTGKSHAYSLWRVIDISNKL